MDRNLRELERQAASGDYDARKAWKLALQRGGFPDPDDISHPLTEEEEIQQHYDDLAWQGRPWKGMMETWCGMGCCGYVSKIAKKLVKGKDFNPFRRTPLAKNSKKKTLRTYRDGSRRGRLTR